MKNFIIKISGIGKIYRFGEIIDNENFNQDIPFDIMEENKIINVISENVILLDKLKIELNNSLIIKKGKYINIKNYFSKFIHKNFFVIGGNDVDIENYYNITLEDDENFDPYKLQLVKSDYELDFIPYGIITDYIIYNGKKIDYCNFVDYPLPEEYWCSIIDYELPYVD